MPLRSIIPFQNSQQLKEDLQGHDHGHINQQSIFKNTNNFPFDILYSLLSLKMSKQKLDNLQN